MRIVSGSRFPSFLVWKYSMYEVSLLNLPSHLTFFALNPSVTEVPYCTTMDMSILGSLVTGKGCIKLIVAKIGSHGGGGGAAIQ